MKFPLFASFIIFCGWLAYELSKTRRKAEQQNKSFWETEAEANKTRRKSLDDLAYITIPFEDLPMDILTEDPKIIEYHETLHTLAENPIVNLTCITNTELKLRYGAPNISLLTRYDQSYTLLARTLQDWASLLNKAGYCQEACSILEFAVSTGTDVSHSYFLLADIYIANRTPEKIQELIPIAEQINSSLSGFIVRKLKESCP